MSGNRYGRWRDRSACSSTRCVGSAYVCHRTEPVVNRKHPVGTSAGCPLLPGTGRLAWLLEIGMSLSSWIVLGLVAGFVIRGMIDPGGHRRRHSGWNRRLDRRWA
jgi:hypothetical protein